MEAAHVQNRPTLQSPILTGHGSMNTMTSFGLGSSFRSWQPKHDALYLPPGPGLFYFKSIKEGDALQIGQCHLILHKHLGKPVVLDFTRSRKCCPKLRASHGSCAPNPAPQRADFSYIQNVPYRNLIAGAHIVLSKAGYGICTETARSRCHNPVDRSTFQKLSFEHFVKTRGALPDLYSQPAQQRETILKAVQELRQRAQPTALGCSGTIRTADMVEAHLKQIFV